MTTRRWVLLGIAVVALVLLSGRAVAGMYADYRWYAALGAGSLWRTMTRLSLFLRVLSGLTVAAFAFLNLFAVRRSVVSLVLPRRVANLEIGEEVPGRYLVGSAALLALVLGALLPLPGESWMLLALLRQPLRFGDIDPFFELDYSYWVAWLPFETTLYVWALIAVLIVAAVVIFLYALTPGLRWERGTFYLSNYVRRHLLVLGAILLALMAWSFRLDAYKLMLNGSGPGGMFSYADHHALVTVNGFLAVLTLAAAVVVAIFGWTGQFRIAFAAVTAVLVLSVGLRQLAPPVVRRMAPEADPDVREASYRRTRALFTQRAFALDRIQRADSSFGFARLGDAGRAVPVWGAVPLEASVVRARRGAVRAREVGWMHALDGLLAVVTLHAASEAVAEEPGGWELVRFRAWAADASGDPVPSNAPGEPDPQVALPQVVVADSASGYEIVSDTAGTIAAPALGGGLDRLAQAWSLQNLRLLSGDLPPGARLVTRRDVRSRLDAIAPFFVQGSTLSPVVADDSLYWAVDLYTVSGFYPLSDHVMFDGDEFSWFQHAALGLVNAHTGRVTLATDAKLDRMAEAWVQRFPELFTPRTVLPADLAAALPPAVDGATVQATMLARYGLRGEIASPGALPEDWGADSALRTQPDPLFLLPTGSLAWSQPVLDAGRRPAGLVVATGGAVGETWWHAVPADGPRWVTRLESLRRALDTTAGVPRDVHLVRGPVRAIPVDGRLALVQPAFTWRGESAPSLARVGVALDSAVLTGTSLAEAADALAPAPPGTSAPPTVELRARATQLYDEMSAALQRGDWAAFGRAYGELGALLHGAPAPTPRTPPPRLEPRFRDR